MARKVGGWLEFFCKIELCFLPSPIPAFHGLHPLRVGLWGHLFVYLTNPHQVILLGSVGLRG